MPAHSYLIHEPAIVSKKKKYYVFIFICILKHYVHIYVFKSQLFKSVQNFFLDTSFLKSKSKILNTMLI